MVSFTTENSKICFISDGFLIHLIMAELLTKLQNCCIVSAFNPIFDKLILTFSIGRTGLPPQVFFKNGP